MMNRGKKWDETEKSRLKEMKRSGLRIKEAAKLLKRTYRGVMHVWGKIPPIKPRRKEKTEVYDQVVILLKKGYKPGKVAKAVGVSHNTVLRWIRNEHKNRQE